MLLFAGFDYKSISNSYYKPIFEPMSWGNATQRCRKLNPSAHLAIVRSLSEYQELVNYLKSMPSKL